MVLGQRHEMDRSVLGTALIDCTFDLVHRHECIPQHHINAFELIEMRLGDECLVVYLLSSKPTFDQPSSPIHAP